MVKAPNQVHIFKFKIKVGTIFPVASLIYCYSIKYIIKNEMKFFPGYIVLTILHFTTL
jgi:hypothetical protein